MPDDDEENAEDMKENEAPTYVSDKKTDELKGKKKDLMLRKVEILFQPQSVIFKVIDQFLLSVCTFDKRD